VDCHVDQRLMGNIEHRLSVGRSDKCCLVPGEGSATLVFIKRIADAERHNLRFAEISVLAENWPNFTRLLACNGRQHVQVEQRARRSRLNFFVKLLLEPPDIVGSRHGHLL